MIQASFRLVAPAGKRREFLDVLLCLKGPTEALAQCRAFPGNTGQIPSNVAPVAEMLRLNG